MAHSASPPLSLSLPQAHINQTFNLGGQGDCSLQEDAEEEEEENEDEGEAAREKKEMKRVLLREIY